MSLIALTGMDERIVDWGLDERLGFDPAVARRLRMLQEYAGAKTQDEMATILGMKKNNWNNQLNFRPLSLATALNIHKTFREISLEWLWLGETDYLTLQTLRRLEEIGTKIR